MARVTGGLGLALVVGIVFYNTVHKLVSFAPLLMGICRFFLYVIAASAADKGVTGWSIWCGLALASYIAGLRYFAHQEGKVGLPSWWPVCLLGIPVVLALIMDAGIYREAGLLLSAVFVLWTLRCLRQTFWSPERNLKDTLSGLVAGIVFVDWLAVADAPRELGMVFLVLFLTALLFQRLLRTA